MIDKASALNTVLTRLRSLPEGHTLALLTYKRDRSVCIRRFSSTIFLVEQNGFSQQRHEVPEKKLRPLLKRLLKQEFPRSNKIRVAELDGTDQRV